MTNTKETLFPNLFSRFLFDDPPLFFQGIVFNDFQLQGREIDSKGQKILYHQRIDLCHSPVRPGTNG